MYLIGFTDDAHFRMWDPVKNRVVRAHHIIFEEGITRQTVPTEPPSVDDKDLQDFTDDPRHDQDDEDDHATTDTPIDHHKDQIPVDVIIEDHEAHLPKIPNPEAPIPIPIQPQPDLLPQQQNHEQEPARHSEQNRLLSTALLQSRGGRGSTHTRGRMGNGR
jgi:hypothetical protein